MATFDQSDDLQGAEFVQTNLRDARFVEADLSGVVMRGVEFERVDIDSSWIFEGENFLLVNGVDVLPFVAAELDRRFPGRAERQATDPAGLQAAWSTIEQAWAATLERVAAMPAGTVDVSVGGEWSFAETLRHLILATGIWLNRAILDLDQPHHPIGVANPDAADNGLDVSVFTTTKPTYDEVLQVRADHVAMVRDYLAEVTPADLTVLRKNPWSPSKEMTTLACLHVILQEEWEHLRFAVRDLDSLDAGAGRSQVQ